MKEEIKIKFIYADLQKSPDKENEIYLDTYGTLQDLERYGIKFGEGKRYWFWRDSKENDPLIFSGVVTYDNTISKWKAKIDTQSITHLSGSKFAEEYTAEEIQS